MHSNRAVKKVIIYTRVYLVSREKKSSLNSIDPIPKKILTKQLQHSISECFFLSRLKSHSSSVISQHSHADLKKRYYYSDELSKFISTAPLAPSKQRSGTHTPAVCCSTLQWYYGTHIPNRCKKFWFTITNHHLLQTPEK